MRLGSEPLDFNNPTGPHRVLHVLTECPVSFITDESRVALEVLLYYQKFKTLPVTGGLFEQPFVVMEMLRISLDEIERIKYLDAIDQRRERERKRKSSRSKRS